MRHHSYWCKHLCKNCTLDIRVKRAHIPLVPRTSFCCLSQDHNWGRNLNQMQILPTWTSGQPWTISRKLSSQCSLSSHLTSISPVLERELSRMLWTNSPEIWNPALWPSSWKPALWAWWSLTGGPEGSPAVTPDLLRQPSELGGMHNTLKTSYLNSSPITLWWNFFPPHWFLYIWVLVWN